MRNPIKSLISSRLSKHRIDAKKAMDGEYATAQTRMRENLHKMSENRKEIARLDKNNKPDLDKAVKLMEENKQLKVAAREASKASKTSASEMKRVRDEANEYAKKKVKKEALVAGAAIAGTTAAGVGAHKLRKASNAKKQARYDEV